MNDQAKYVVIGAGIVGLCVSRRLAQAGEDVLVLERRRVGGGASGAAAGVLEAAWRPRSEFQRNLAASYAGYAQFVSELREETREEVEFSRTGSLTLALDEETEQRLDKRFRKLRDEDAPVHWLTREDLLAIFGDGSDSLRAALRHEECQRVHPPDLMRVLRRSVEGLGVRVVEDLTAVGLEEIGPGYQLSCVAGDREASLIKAERVIVCAGAWTSDLLRKFGVETEADVVPVRGQMIELEASAISPFECVLHFDDHSLIIPRPDRRIWVGATVEELDDFEDRATDEGEAELFERARKVFPQIHFSDIRRSWSGLRPKLLRRGGALLSVDGISILAGHYRNGILGGPRDADRLVGELLGRRVSPYW